MSDAMINLAPEGAGSSVGQGIDSSLKNLEKTFSLFKEFWKGILNKLAEDAEKEDYSEVVGNNLEESIKSNVYSEEIIAELVNDNEFANQIFDELILRGVSIEFARKVVEKLEQLREQERIAKYSNQVVNDLASNQGELEVIEGDFEEIPAQYTQAVIDDLQAVSELQESNFTPSMGELRQSLADAISTDQGDSIIAGIVDNIKQLAEDYGGENISSVPDEFRSKNVTLSDNQFQQIAAISNEAAKKQKMITMTTQTTVQHKTEIKGGQER
jgi:hypothetical protein